MKAMRMGLSLGILFLVLTASAYGGSFQRPVTAGYDGAAWWERLMDMRSKAVDTTTDSAVRVKLVFDILKNELTFPTPNTNLEANKYYMDSNGYHEISVIHCLRAFSDIGDAEPLRKALSDEGLNSELGKYLAIALGRLGVQDLNVDSAGEGDRAVLTTLISIVSNEQYDFICQEAAESLGFMRDKAAVLPVLQKALRDPRYRRILVGVILDPAKYDWYSRDYRVRRAANIALRRLGFTTVANEWMMWEMVGPLPQGVNLELKARGSSVGAKPIASVGGITASERITASEGITASPTMVELSKVAYALGFELASDESSKTCNLTRAGWPTITFTVGSTKATIGDEEVSLERAPEVRGTRLYVPVEFTARALGFVYQLYSGSVRVWSVGPQLPELPKFVEYIPENLPQALIRWHSDTQTLEIWTPDRRIFLTAGSSQAIMDEVRITFENPVVLEDGALKVPDGMLKVLLKGIYSYRYYPSAY